MGEKGERGTEGNLHKKSKTFFVNFLKSGDCTNCGNTTEATILFQQFIKKKTKKKKNKQNAKKTVTRKLWKADFVHG